MNMQVMKYGNTVYLEAMPRQKLIENEHDAVDVIGVCGEHNSTRLLLYAENLTDQFFDLKTRVAGQILQKFMNYGIRAALVLSPDFVQQGRFAEMALEANRGRYFGIFHDKAEAEQWLRHD